MRGIRTRLSIAVSGLALLGVLPLSTSRAPTPTGGLVKAVIEPQLTVGGSGLIPISVPVSFEVKAAGGNSPWSAGSPISACMCGGSTPA